MSIYRHQAVLSTHKQYKQIYYASLVWFCVCTISAHFSKYSRQILDQKNKKTMEGGVFCEHIMEIMEVPTGNKV